ncbi:MT-A70 family methyltransferase [Agrobacterium tumefaciens]|uniref:MT-A70 family methyltransferase n=1 Tax=Agrobacterium tumefaciens TaxID=358 RepID=UPI001573C41E|nr:DNA methyltransferase [Agrobacterium tumefaciens]
MRLFPELWPFGDLPPFSFDLIMADPPWLYKLRSEKGEGKSAQAHYNCMPLDQIKAMPVLDLASENCLLWLWATNPMVIQAYEVLLAWGFDFVTMGSWEKTTKNGKQAFGPGYVFRTSNEPILIGRRGEPKTTKSVRSSFAGVVRGHSRKPEEGYRQAEKLMPNARRLELFSRTNRKGWTVWGDETGKFGEAA